MGAGGRKMSPEEVKAVFSLRAHGFSLSQISDRIGVTRQHIHQILTGASYQNVQIPEEVRKVANQYTTKLAYAREVRNANILKLIDEGHTQLEAARLCGCSIATVSRLVNK